MLAVHRESADLVREYVEEERRGASLCIDVELHGCMEAEEGSALGRVEEDAERDRKQESRRLARVLGCGRVDFVIAEFDGAIVYSLPAQGRCWW